MNRKISIAVTAGCVAALAVAALLSAPTAAVALSGSDFDPGNIISDAIFFNSQAMSETDIQSFVESKETGCTATNGMPCLKDYSQATFDRAASATHCSFYAGASNELASQIVFKVAQACGLNPQVLLVTLEKEQGLVSSVAPSQARYDRATGYGCPDTPSGCDAKYYGFYNQVYLAAWQLKEYTVDPSYWNFRPGNFAIRYSDSDGCNGPVVNIRDLATAALYNYTPYQPNAAALANLYGRSSDPCSAYGNRNFWTTFTAWFGSPTGPTNPFGSVDFVKIVPGGVRVAGWTLDPNTPDSIPVHVYINGVGYPFMASASRPDVAAAYPGFGAAHGYDVTVPVSVVGPQQVCIFGINQGPGANTLFQCLNVQPESGSPALYVDSESGAGGSINISGWSFDPDSASSIPVSVSIDGHSTSIVANFPREDIATTFPDYGANHGFTANIAATPGAHSVCISAPNFAGPGSTNDLGCSMVTVLSGLPLGSLDTVTAAPGVFKVSGWAFDPDTIAPSAVHVYVGGMGEAFVASGQRPDVGAVYTGYGSDHGFNVSVPAHPGIQNVCAYAIDSENPNLHTTLGCRLLQGMSGSPVGSVDIVSTVQGGVEVAGWGLDPDTNSSISVGVSVDSSQVVTTANGNRPDIAAAYPLYGAAHGFVQMVTGKPGAHTVCVTARNVLYGSDTSLGCFAANF